MAHRSLFQDHQGPVRAGTLRAAQQAGKRPHAVKRGQPRCSDQDGRCSVLPKKQGVLRWWCLSALAFLLCHLQDLALPVKSPGTWADWGDLARTVRFLFVPEIRRQALELELQALDAFQHALLVLET